MEIHKHNNEFRDKNQDIKLHKTWISALNNAKTDRHITETNENVACEAPYQDI